MVREQHAAAIGRENPGGGRDVAGPAGAIEAVGVRFDERHNSIGHASFLGESLAIAREHFEQRPAGHEGLIVDSG